MATPMPRVEELNDQLGGAKFITMLVMPMAVERGRKREEGKEKGRGEGKGKRGRKREEGKEKGRGEGKGKRGRKREEGKEKGGEKEKTMSSKFILFHRAVTHK